MKSTRSFAAHPFLHVVITCVIFCLPCIGWAQAPTIAPTSSTHAFADCHQMQLHLGAAQGALTQGEYNRIFQQMQYLTDLRARRRCAEDLSYWDILNGNFARARLTIDYLHQHQIELPSEHLRCLNAVELIGSEASSHAHLDDGPSECPTTMAVIPQLSACHTDPMDPMDERVMRAVVSLAAPVCRDHGLHDEHVITHPLADRLIQLNMGGMEEAVRLYRAHQVDLPWGAADAILLASLEHAERELSTSAADDLAVRVYGEEILRGREYLERVEEMGETRPSSPSWSAPNATELIVQGAIMAFEAHLRLSRPRNWCESLEVMSHPSATARHARITTILDDRARLYPPGQDIPAEAVRHVARLFIPEQPEPLAVSLLQGQRYIELWCANVLGHPIVTTPATTTPDPCSR